MEHKDAGQIWHEVIQSGCYEQCPVDWVHYDGLKHSSGAAWKDGDKAVRSFVRQVDSLTSWKRSFLSPVV